MDLHDPVAVYSPRTLAEGEAIAQALSNSGIPAKVLMEEVVVAQADAERAAEALKAYEHSLTVNAPQTFINAICEECGQSSTFDGSLAGSVQDCPHCGKFMDVAPQGNDQEWGEPEEEEAEPDEE